MSVESFCVASDSYTLEKKKGFMTLKASGKLKNPSENIITTANVFLTDF